MRIPAHDRMFIPEHSLIISSEVAMFVRYSFSQLSPEEEDFLSRVFLEEVQIQSWFIAVYTTLLQEESLVTVQ